MSRAPRSPSRALHHFAVLTALATLPLIFIGGLVTSHGAALAVPDWPTSYGYNMFFFPWRKMVGGIFYEHSHRLVASAVGFMTVILAVWLWIQEPRGWVRRLGWIALVLVVFQGLLGGLRVMLLKQEIAIFHACLAQAFFCLLAGIAFFTSSWWMKRREIVPARRDALLRKLALGITVWVFIQLALGAAMRHTNSGLAVPDFPLMYGKIIPPLGSSALESANQQRIWRWGLEPVSFSQIAIHLAHRLGAVILLITGSVLLRRVYRRHWDCAMLRRLALLFIGLLMIQAALGGVVIWTQKAADIATAHVALGALTLAASFLMTLAVFKVTAPSERRASLPIAEGVAA